MLWSRYHRYLILLICIVAAGCGFTPLHQAQNGSAVSGIYKDIAIPVIPDRNGQYLRNKLIDTFYVGHTPQGARYELRLTPLQSQISNLGIQSDATVTRVQVEMSTTLELFDTQTAAAVLTRPLHAVGGYDVLDAQYATLIARRYVTERILDDLAANITTAVNLYFHDLPADARR